MLSLPRSGASPRSFARSNAWLEQAKTVIPGLTLSMMKRPEQFAPEHFPVYLAHGRGALVTDVDGNEYVDFICGLGASSLGHGHPDVLAAVRGALEAGLIHSLPVPLEVEASRLLTETIPHAEMARFFKTGADATSAAVRLARALTGKERILTIGYNGWHDQFMFDTPGVPKALAELTQRMPLFVPENEAPILDAIASGSENLAAVLISLPYNRVVGKEFLQQLREACTSHGMLLVFDEIVTGFRLALGGAQEFFGVKADYVCVSKALAAGLPLSAVVGPRQVLEPMERLQVSTTFGGELLSLAVCQAALKIYRETRYIEHIAELGRKLREGVNQAALSVNAPLRVLGYDAIPFFLFDPDVARHTTLMRRFQGEMAARGVLLRRDVNFICGAHTAEQMDFAVQAAHESLVTMKGDGLFA